jgi:hypothetical protein
MTPEEKKARAEDQAVQLKGLELVNKIGEETETVADGVTALVGVTDEGLRGLADVFRGVERIVGKDGDPGPPGPPGPPGASVKGDPGPPGLDGSAPALDRADLERNALGLVDRVEQRFDDGTRRQLRVERDATGRLLAIVAVRS